MPLLMLRMTGIVLVNPCASFPQSARSIGRNCFFEFAFLVVSRGASTAPRYIYEEINDSVMKEEVGMMSSKVLPMHSLRLSPSFVVFKEGKRSLLLRWSQARNDDQIYLTSSP